MHVVARIFLKHRFALVTRLSGPSATFYFVSFAFGKRDSALRPKSCDFSPPKTQFHLYTLYSPPHSLRLLTRCLRPTGDSHSDRVPSSSSPSSQPPPAPKPNPFGNAKPVNIPDPTLREDRPPRAAPPPAKEATAEAEEPPPAASGSAASLPPSSRSGEDVSGSASSSSGVGR